jgi:hypothetical protein
MHLNAISFITEQATGEKSPRPIPRALWVRRVEKTIGRKLTDETAQKIAVVGRILWDVYEMAQEEDDPPEPRSLLHSVEMCKTRDIARLLLHPERTSGRLGEMLGLSERAIRSGRSTVERWFNVRFMFLHTQAHHVTWWLPTKFAKRTWPMLESIVMLSMEF